MVEVYGINTKTHEKVTVDMCKNERQANKFCEEWGWIYDDETGRYWLGIEESEDKDE